MKPYDSRTYFEKLCLRAQMNFDDYAEAHCNHAGHLPSTPSYTNPVGKTYFKKLESMMTTPMKTMSNFDKKLFVWSGLCEKSQDGYVLTDFGKKYVDRVHFEVESWGKCEA